MMRSRRGRRIRDLPRHRTERLSPQHDVGRVVRGGMLDHFETERRQIDSREHRFAAAENDGGDREVQLVDQPALEILPHGGNTAADLDVFAAGGRLGLFQRDLDPFGDEMKNRAALHRDGIARMMGEDEGRHVIRRIGAPPAFPFVIGPVAANRPEHVAPQNERAETRHRPCRVAFVDAIGAAVFADHGAKGLRAEKPFEQFRAALAQRIAQALVGPGAEPVDREREPRDDHLGHCPCPFTPALSSRALARRAARGSTLEDERLDDDRYGLDGLQHLAEVDEVEIADLDAVHHDHVVRHLELARQHVADEAGDIGRKD